MSQSTQYARTHRPLPGSRGRHGTGLSHPRRGTTVAVSSPPLWDTLYWRPRLLQSLKV
jgi:hypothetical protein